MDTLSDSTDDVSALLLNKGWEPIGKRADTELSGHVQLQSPQLVEPLWTDPGIKSGISVRELSSTSKKKKKSAGRE